MHERSGAGKAGASAQREYERRQGKREAEVRARHPRLAGLLLALSNDPQSTKAWAKGAEGERRVGAGLDALAGAGVVTLHDRRIPGSKANIDHIAVGPNGVWVLDAKRYKGVVARRDVGGWFRTDMRLYVGGRDRTNRVTAMARQVAAVRAALGDEWAHVPIRPALCFVDAEWPFFAKAFELQGVTIAGPGGIARLVSGAGPYSGDGIERIVDRLERRLRAA